MLGDPNDDQQAQPAVHADITVDAIGPPAHIALLAQVLALPGLMLVQPAGFQPGDGVG